MSKHIGFEGGYQGLVSHFRDGGWDWIDKKKRELPPPDGFPTEDEILYAHYETPSYEGYATVVFRRNGQLFIVQASHCSCFGLEGQWDPTKTTTKALQRMKFSGYEQDDNAHSAWAAMIVELGA